MTFPHLNGRAEKLAAEFQLTPETAEWIAVTAVHAGCFLRSQYHCYSNQDRKAIKRFARGLVKQKLVVETPVDGLGLLCRVTNKNVYRALGEADSRHRRLAHWPYMSRRLLSLDYVLDHPELPWLASEDEKVKCFENLEIFRVDLPFRIYRGAGAGGYTKRYFANKHPISVDPQDKQAVFVYTDSDEKSTQGLDSWRKEHAALLAALHRKGFRLSIVYATRNQKLSASVKRLFEAWANTPASEEARSKDARELQRLYQALAGDDERGARNPGSVISIDRSDDAHLSRLGGFNAALRRAAALERRLENKSKPAGYEASYDVWLSKRIPAKGDKHNRLGPRHGEAQAAGDDDS